MMRWWVIGLLIASMLMVIAGTWSLYNLIVLTVIALIIRAVLRYRSPNNFPLKAGNK